MARNVTVSFEDGSQHVYQNVPDEITPDQFMQRASAEFSNKKIVSLDGGRQQQRIGVIQKPQAAPIASAQQPEQSAQSAIGYLGNKLAQSGLRQFGNFGRFVESSVVAPVIDSVNNGLNPSTVNPASISQLPISIGAALLNRMMPSTKITGQDIVDNSNRAYDRVQAFGRENFPANDAGMSKGMQVAGAVADTAPLIAAAIINPLAGAAMMEMEAANRTFDDVRKNNVNVDTAQRLLANRTGMNILQTVLPVASGAGGLARAATGSGYGAAGAVAGSAMEKKIYENGGYNDIAQSIDPLDLANIIPAAALGGAFGVATRDRANPVVQNLTPEEIQQQQAYNFDVFNRQADPSIAAAEAKQSAQGVVDGSIVQPNLSLAELIAGKTGAPITGETPADLVRAEIEREAQLRKTRADFNQGELSKQVQLYGSELPPQYRDTPITQEQAVEQSYADAGLDAGSIANAFTRLATVDENNLPQAQREITQKANNQEFARQAFTIADALQRRADSDLANNGTIAPDYQGGLAAASGGTVNGNERAVFMVGENAFEPVRDAVTGDPIVTRGYMMGEFTDVNGNKFNGAVQAGKVEVITSPANPRLAQDFMARSSTPTDKATLTFKPREGEGVGVGTMAQERMPTRSTDRISGDKFGGEASALSDPYTTEPREPSGKVDVEQAPKREGLKAPRTTDTINNEADNTPQSTALRTVDGEGVRRPYDIQPDTQGKLPAPPVRDSLPAPEKSIRVDKQGNAARETPEQQNQRLNAEDVNRKVADYSRNDLGNTAKNVGRTEVSDTRADFMRQQAEQRQQEREPNKVDSRLDDDEYRSALQAYAGEVGWATEGGRMIRDPATDEVVGRTSWEGKADWWQSAPKELRAGNGKFFREAVNKVLTGDKLNKAEERSVKWVLDHYDDIKADGIVQDLARENGFIPFVLEGRKIEFEVDVNGKKVKVEQDAMTAMADAKKRIDALKELRDCVS